MCECTINWNCKFLPHRVLLIMFMEISPPIDNSERTPKRDQLSNEEVGNLLASFGNSEAKALLVTEMHPNIIYGQSALQQLINSAQGEYPGWKVDHGATWHWCERSLEPIGLVAMEITDQQANKYGYLKTKYGDEIGVPLAGLLLDFSRRHPQVSLYQLMGSTLSSSQSAKSYVDIRGETVEVRKRAPATRLKMFWELATRDGTLRVADLLTAMNEDAGAVNKNLEQLDDFGLLTYEAIKGQKPFVTYKLTASPEAASYFNQGVQTKTLIKIMDANRERWLSLQDILDELVMTDPMYQNLTKDQYQAIRGALDGRLSAWSNRKLVIARDFQGRDRSQIELTEEQRALMAEFVNLIDGFQSQDPSILKRGRSLVNSLSAADKASLMAKAEEASPFGSNKSSYGEMEATFLRLVKENPGISGTDIKMMLREKPFNKRLTTNGAEKVLNMMKKRGFVKNTVEGRTNKWNLTS